MVVTGDIGPLTFYTSQRGKLVAFPRAPPLSPPSPTQEYFRAYFIAAATAWRALTQPQRNDWSRAAYRAHLSISGINLWFWFYRTRDEENLHTIEAQTGITLARPA